MSKKVILVDDSQTVHISFGMAIEELVSSGEIEKVSYFNPLEFIGDIKKGLDMIYVSQT